MLLHAEISEELRRRKITRSSNNPVGDLAEHLCCQAYFRNAYVRNAGLRIDHLMLTPDLAKGLKRAEVDMEVRGGWEKTSDHAPVWIELNGVGARR